MVNKLNKDCFDWIEDGQREKEYPIDTTHWGGRIVGQINIDFVQVATDVIVKIDPRLASFNEYKVLKDKKLKLPKKGRELWLKTLEERNVIT